MKLHRLPRWRSTKRHLEIVKFGLTNEEGNFTYIVLKLQSDYNLAYNGMIFLLCLFSLFVIYSVFSISVSEERNSPVRNIADIRYQ